VSTGRGTGGRRVPHVVVGGALLAVVLIAATSPGALAGTSTTTSVRSGMAKVYTPGTVQHVVWLWFENRSEPAIIGSAKAPYLNSLASGYGYASAYHNLSHPSVPNYLGATSGLPQPSLPTTDCTNCRQSVASLFTEGETWRSYNESMPTPCDRVMSPDGLYVPRHNPALYYTLVASSTCKADDVPYPQLASDLAGNRLPAFAFVAPNTADDMHSGTIGAADSWLAKNLPQILTSSAYTSGSTAVFITWDEGTGAGKTNGMNCTASTNVSCNVALIVVSPYTTPGTVATGSYTHYSLLRLTEELLGLPLLGQAASAADPGSAFGL
jgi:phosphatidylinositol-3-phosphatase